MLHFRKRLASVSASTYLNCLLRRQLISSSNLEIFFLCCPAAQSVILSLLKGLLCLFRVYFIPYIMSFLQVRVPGSISYSLGS